MLRKAWFNVKPSYVRVAGLNACMLEKPNECDSHKTAFQLNPFVHGPRNPQNMNLSLKVDGQVLDRCT